ncbi:hypothetical protein HYPSUDRAFT_197692 [Hypholoma sublateritium FD-334 SS-4]|uniref:Uncharacterized protein n=1 Tax=Hypholoma sublateritium (strain FD-334 SS-4) TaxID=945553 RepID=A0A0D2MW48_HYPSF|nr:hypothetical protein HYPSUDRAFT_197692 [Hypholoma sublateritium FD-334 SS-4]
MLNPGQIQFFKGRNATTESSYPTSPSAKGTLLSGEYDHFSRNLHDQVCNETDREFLIYDANVFIAKCLPFVPTDTDIAKLVSLPIPFPDLRIVQYRQGSLIFVKVVMFFLIATEVELGYDL